MNQTKESELKWLNESNYSSNSSYDNYFKPNNSDFSDSDKITKYEDTLITEIESSYMDMSLDDCVLNQEYLNENEQIICVELMNNNRVFINY